MAEHHTGTDDTNSGSPPSYGQADGRVTDAQIALTQNISWTPLVRDMTLGLMAIGAPKSKDIHARAYSYNYKSDGATIEVSSWDDTELYWGRADHVFWGFGPLSPEYGTIYTVSGTKSSNRVEFWKRYDVPPTVVVFFYYLDLVTTGTAWRIRAFPKDVTMTGFTVVVESWNKSEFKAVGVSWIAIPANSTHYRVGSYSTTELHGPDRVGQKHSKAIEFSPPLGDKAYVFTGLNKIVMYNDQDLRINLWKESISGKGFTWHIDSWADSKIVLASASYIAW